MWMGGVFVPCVCGTVHQCWLHLKPQRLSRLMQQAATVLIWLKDCWKQRKKKQSHTSHCLSVFLSGCLAVCLSVCLLFVDNSNYHSYLVIIARIKHSFKSFFKHCLALHPFATDLYYIKAFSFFKMMYRLGLYGLIVATLLHAWLTDLWTTFREREREREQDSQIDIHQTHRRTNRHTYRQRGRQTDRQTYTQTDR